VLSTAFFPKQIGLPLKSTRLKEKLPSMNEETWLDGTQKLVASNPNSRPDHNPTTRAEIKITAKGMAQKWGKKVAWGVEEGEGRSFSLLVSWFDALERAFHSMPKMPWTG
jgi:hypothetical protein